MHLLLVDVAACALPAKSERPMDTQIRRHVQLIRTSCEIGIQAFRAGAFAGRSFPECGKLRNTPRALTCHTRPYRKRQNAHHPCYVALTSLFPSIKRPKKEADTGAATSSDDSPTTDEDHTTSDKDANTPDDVASTITRRPPYVPARNCRHITAALNHRIAFYSSSMPSTLSV